MTSYDAAKRRHNIGSSGVCENCGCSEAAIAKFGWDCGLEDTAPRNTKSRLIWSYIALAVTFTVAVTSWWLPRYFPDVAEFAMQLDNEFVDILLVILLPLIAATVYFFILMLINDDDYATGTLFVSIFTAMGLAVFLLMQTGVWVYDDDIREDKNRHALSSAYSTEANHLADKLLEAEIVSFDEFVLSVDGQSLAKKPVLMMVYNPDGDNPRLPENKTELVQFVGRTWISEFVEPEFASRVLNRELDEHGQAEVVSNAPPIGSANVILLVTGKEFARTRSRKANWHYDLFVSYMDAYFLELTMGIGTKLPGRVAGELPHWERSFRPTVVVGTVTSKLVGHLPSRHNIKSFVDVATGEFFDLSLRDKLYGSASINDWRD